MQIGGRSDLTFYKLIDTYSLPKSMRVTAPTRMSGDGMTNQ
jgi:hypothetical protein